MGLASMQDRRLLLVGAMEIRLPAPPLAALCPKPQHAINNVEGFLHYYGSPHYVGVGYAELLRLPQLPGSVHLILNPLKSSCSEHRHKASPRLHDGVQDTAAGLGPPALISACRQG